MLPQLKIHVNGSASVFRTAERGVLHIRVSSSNTSQAQASSDVTTTTENMISTFRRFALKTEDGIYPHPSAGITTFSSSAPVTSSYITQEATGKPGEIKYGPRAYTATTTAEVVFRDLNLLARLASELAAMQNVSITRTEWRLTDATRTEICREARVKAIRDAVQKAEDYAGVVGREVVAVNIKDGPTNTGMFNNNPMQMQMQMPQMPQMQAQARQVQLAQARQATMAEQAAPVTNDGPPLEPSTLTVSAHVDVHFVSKDGEALVE